MNPFAAILITTMPFILALLYPGTRGVGALLALKWMFPSVSKGGRVASATWLRGSLLIKAGGMRAPPRMMCDACKDALKAQ